MLGRVLILSTALKYETLSYLIVFEKQRRRKEGPCTYLVIGTIGGGRLFYVVFDKSPHDLEEKQAEDEPEILTLH